VPDNLSNVVDTDCHPLSDARYRRKCAETLEQRGVVVLPGFLRPHAIENIRQEGIALQSLAYYTANKHNVYLAPSDPQFSSEHCRNREVMSTKGCITTDRFAEDSVLRSLYDAPDFRAFLCSALNESELHEYADPLSSINLHYAADGQELGWHFDNSSFAITMLIQKPAQGGQFEYVKDVRDADAGEMNYAMTTKVLDGKVGVECLSMDAGDLVLFRGRNSMHRVTPVLGDITRMLVVLAYNSEPGVAISESASRTFFGRYGE